MSPDQESPDALEPIETEDWQAARGAYAVATAHSQLIPLHVRDVPAIVQRDMKVNAAKRGLKMGAMLEAVWLFFAENQDQFDTWRETTELTG